MVDVLLFFEKLFVGVSVFIKGVDFLDYIFVFFYNVYLLLNLVFGFVILGIRFFLFFDGVYFFLGNDFVGNKVVINFVVIENLCLN